MGRCVHEADEKWGGESKGADEKWGGESICLEHAWLSLIYLVHPCTNYF